MTSEQIEACVSCGRDTRSGTRLFTDRRTTRDDDGVAIYLCGDCNERAISHVGRQPTERDWSRSPRAAPASGWAGVAPSGPAAARADRGPYVT